MTFNNNQFDGPAWRLSDNTEGPAVTLAMITDGTSNTAAHSEWIKGKNTLYGRQAIYVSTLSYNPCSPCSPALLGTMQQTLQAVAATCQPNLASKASKD